MATVKNIDRPASDSKCTGLASIWLTHTKKLMPCSPLWASAGTLIKTPNGAASAKNIDLTLIII
jgi:hypothetical protein